MMVRVLKNAYLGLVYLFLYVPILVLVVFSFNSSKYAIGWQGFSLKWYAELFASAQLLDAAVNSLIIASLSATAATILGTLTAFAIFRYHYPGRRLMHSVLFIVIMSPDIVVGVSLLILFVAAGMEPGFTTLLLAHITFCLPFVAVTVASRLDGFDSHIVEAAQDLGADEFAAFRHIVLPLIMPAIIAGWLLSFTLSLDDVIISFFVTGPGFEILPLKIYSMVKLGVKPVVNALCTIMVSATVLIVLISQFLLRERK